MISDGVAYEVTRILEENVQYGTGTGAAYGQDAAGKTGTTEEHSDAWFCGYTPRLGTTVWVGYPKGKIPMENVHGISVSGGSFPADIWRLFMSSAIGQLDSVSFPEPTDWPEWTDVRARARSAARSATPGPTTSRRTTTDERRRRRPSEPPPAAAAPRSRSRRRRSPRRRRSARGDARRRASASAAGDDRRRRGWCRADRAP